MVSKKRHPRKYFVPFLFVVLICVLCKFIRIPESLKSSSLGIRSVNFGSDATLQPRSDDGSCNATAPCSNGACCGGGANGLNTYCGYGPGYCGSTCLSNCNATAPCGQFAKIVNTTCPLNVCCSPYGFCGTTELFCTGKCQSNCVLIPSPPPGGSSVDVRQKVIGYYESWSSTRTCQQMLPGGIPVDGLTHVNHAFAYLTPETFEIVSMDPTLPADLFQTVADAKTFKSGNQNLEVFASLGGWDFTDPTSSTQPLFGEIAGDPAKRQLFCDNTLKFVNQYGFDGIDIDWEYPGASDRGGKVEDTANFVFLLKSLRATFDSYPRTLGISFTVPSSYWYLQWFDLLAMIEYADWINLMSYDLHGVWDSSDPIGNQVLAHTNLTEIKMAVELLWRVNIPPAKVVLGTGFYGRAFQLSDPTCKTPGCAFSGAANPGPCTNSAGTLSYFEIMAILNGDSTKTPLIHDEVDAVNYFTFDENQWVSFDNNVTFQQKVAWANGIGLGGLMIWSIDQDDTKFTALSGLLGKSLGGLGGNQQPIAVSQDWSGQNGQACTAFSKCVDLKNPQASSCGSGQISIGYDEGGCKNGYGKPFCCPVTAAPRSCTWRGGESIKHSGVGDCNGQCHAGEVGLFGSSWGGKPTDGNQLKCGRGGKLFCCVADNWATAIDGCSFGKCGGGCSSGYESVTWKHDPQFCAFPRGGSGPQNRDYCCPAPAKFGDCNWVGKGDCAQNSCDTDEIELMTDTYGQTSRSCNWGRQKVCCCPSPSEPAFLPVSLPDIFPPALPPSQDFANYDLQFPKGGSDPSKADAIGWVIVVGPTVVVSSADKRAKRDGIGSHLEFLNCHELNGPERQTVKFVCTTRGPYSNCDDMMEGGLEGTIIEMPDDCGAGKYVVAHAVADSEDQTLPWYLEGIKNTTVRELTFDYNFRLMKRDAGTVYVRMDYANVPGYWDSVVDSAPGKRSAGKRFWSNADTAWSTKFRPFENTEPSPGRYGTIFSTTFDKTLLSVSKSCSLTDSAFAYIRASGEFEGTVQTGISLIATLDPAKEKLVTFLEAHSFILTGSNTVVNVEAAVKGNLNVPYTVATLFEPLTDQGFSHPGLISVEPQVIYDVAITAENLTLEANFTTGTHAFINESILQPLPLETEPMQGQTAQNSGPVKSSFDGEVFAGSGGSLKLDFRPRMGLKISMEQIGTSEMILDAFAENSFDTYNAITFNSDSSFSLIQGTGPASGTLTYDFLGTRITAWDSNDESDHVVGTGASSVLWTGTPGEESGRSGDGQPWHSIKNDSSSIFWSVANGVQCSNVLSMTVTCPTSLCILIPDLCTDDDSEAGDDESTSFANLDKRGGVTNYPVDLEDGDPTPFSVPSDPYPSIGVLFNGPQGQTVLNRTFLYVWRPDCGNYDIIDFDRDTNTNEVCVTEHILELQTIPRWIEAAVTGILPSGNRMRAHRIPASFFRNSWLTSSLPTGLPTIGTSFNSQVPNQRVFQTLGSNSNRVQFVATATDLNAVKSRIWRGVDIIAESNLNINLDKALNMTAPQATRDSARESVLGPIRATRATFSYLNENADVTQRLLASAAAARAQIQLIESNIPAAAGLTATWDEYIQDQFDTMQETARNWMDETIATVGNRYTSARPTPPDLAEVQAILARLQDSLRTIGMPKLPKPEEVVMSSE